ncbi:hypothetical protein M409DRAFT_19142 [Zasmidium cellare ATCC 36951]|uniref:Uncharacterized protein n=1 Tax=Zasmidium cellare ATCC 36951 TaxID=1080233 RepID=A0A6A6CVU3_ZASCE|nr:uncharacterized protein M409DRAFT_19142 [Zasmidium cellare ATCC 36951]KAF2170320.1 hypothetical protein M409DRAFT_19142 [Zasmidium cellare ATCC 36951]
MPSSKPRLYVALHPCGTNIDEKNKYRWSFLVGPKKESANPTPGTRFRVKNSPSRWVYEETHLSNVQMTKQLLARILIAKVEDYERLVSILRNVPIVQGDPSWRCWSWIASALEMLEKDGKAVGTAELNWDKIEAKGRQYVAQKTANGRYEDGINVLEKPRPTWDLIDNKETIS